MSENSPGRPALRTPSRSTRLPLPWVSEPALSAAPELSTIGGACQSGVWCFVFGTAHHSKTQDTKHNTRGAQCEDPRKARALRGSTCRCQVDPLREVSCGTHILSRGGRLPASLCFRADPSHQPAGIDSLLLNQLTGSRSRTRRGDRGSQLPEGVGRSRPLWLTSGAGGASSPATAGAISAGTEATVGAVLYVLNACWPAPNTGAA